jgi:molybdopterin/thiamine biosynthesis adenylyltransferase
MKQNRLIILNSIFSAMRERLSDPQKEHLLFGYLGVNQHARGRDFLCVDGYLPSPEEYCVQRAGLVTFPAYSVARVLKQSKGWNGLLDWHNHTGGFPRFSAIDNSEAEKELRNIWDFKGDNYLLRLVQSDGRVAAELTDRTLYPGWEPLDEIRVIGKQGIKLIYPENSRIKKEKEGESIDLEGHLRTLEFYPKRALKQLAGLHFGVIGGGGTGSAFLNLIKFFVREITIVEADAVERHNSGRLFHYISGDEGKLKALIHKRDLERFSPGITVNVVYSMFPSEDSVEALKACDFLVAAPDNNFTRYKAAEFASRYMKPLLEMGSGVRMRDGEVASIGSQVRFQLPTKEGKCLVCNGLEVENLQTPEFVEYKRGIGYIEGADAEETPGSVVTINSIAATICLRIILDYLGGYTGREIPSYIYYDELNLRLVDLSDAFSKHPECAICSSNPNSIFGRGDELPERLQVLKPRERLEEGDLCQC